MDYSASNQEKITKFLYVILKRKWFILVFFITTYTGIVAGTWLAPQYYKATTKIFIHNNPKQEITLFSDMAKYTERDSRVNLASDMVEFLTSEHIAREIVSSFELDKLYYKKKYEPEALRDVVWYYINKTIDIIELPYTYFELFLVSQGLAEPEQEEDYFFSAMCWFLDDWLDVNAVRETKVINLSIWGPTPLLAAKIANRMAELMVEQTLEVTQNQALDGYNFAVTQLQNTEDKYLESLEQVKMFRKNNNIASIEDQKKVTVLSLNKFENELAEIEAELYGTVKKANKIRADLQKENKKIIGSNLTGNNTVVIELKSRLKDLEIGLNSMLLEKTEKNIDVIKLRGQINEISGKLKKELENIINSNTEGINLVHQSLRQNLIELESQKELLRAKKIVLSNNTSELKKQLVFLSEKGIELDVLATKAEIYSSHYKTVKDKLEKLLIMKNNEINEYGLSVIYRADLPAVMSPSWPWWEINMFYIGIPLSIVLALFACFFLDFWTDRFSTKKEVEFEMELPVIGSLPYIRKKGGNH